jgi:hypothetical protein
MAAGRQVSVDEIQRLGIRLAAARKASGTDRFTVAILSVAVFVYGFSMMTTFGNSSIHVIVWSDGRIGLYLGMIILTLIAALAIADYRRTRESIPRFIDLDVPTISNLRPIMGHRMLLSPQRISRSVMSLSTVSDLPTTGVVTGTFEQLAKIFMISQPDQSVEWLTKALRLSTRQNDFDVSRSANLDQLSLIVLAYLHQTASPLGESEANASWIAERLAVLNPLSPFFSGLAGTTRLLQAAKIILSDQADSATEKSLKLESEPLWSQGSQLIPEFKRFEVFEEPFFKLKNTLIELRSPISRLADPRELTSAGFNFSSNITDEIFSIAVGQACDHLLFAIATSKRDTEVAAADVSYWMMAIGSIFLLHRDLDNALSWFNEARTITTNSRGNETNARSLENSLSHQKYPQAQTFEVALDFRELGTRNVCDNRIRILKELKDVGMQKNAEYSEHPIIFLDSHISAAIEGSKSKMPDIAGTYDYYDGLTELLENLLPHQEKTLGALSREQKYAACWLLRSYLFPSVDALMFRPTLPSWEHFQ